MDKPQLAAVVLCLAVLLTAAYVGLEPYVEAVIWERIFAPAFEERLGFKGARRMVSDVGRQYDEYYLADVLPDGPLYRSGFRSGDAPTGAMHAQSVAFINTLDTGCLAPTTVTVRRRGGGEDGRVELPVPCVK